MAGKCNLRSEKSVCGAGGARDRGRHGVKGVQGKKCGEVGEGCVLWMGACLHCSGCFRVAVGD